MGCMDKNSTVTEQENNSASVDTNQNASKSLVVYFSRAGENSSVGNIEKGNTEIIAEMIAQETNADLFKIEPVEDYPVTYDECVALAKQEKESNARPEIKGDIDIDKYDVIFVGYPIWWSDMPMPVYTFLEAHQYEEKTIIPFCTHEGSGLANTENYLRNVCKGAEVLNGLAIRGRIAQNEQEKAKEEVENWLKEINIIK